MSNTTKQITEAIKGAQKSKTSAYDTQAEVRRVEGNTAWVHIPGGVDETPVKMTIAAKKGDTVQVRVSDGTAFLIGNASAPPTDDATANTAIYVATNAQTEADTAHKAAVDAVTSAEQAKASAESAASSASAALSSAQSAQQSADSALVSLSTVEDVVGVLNWITAHGTMTLTSDVTINPAHVYFVVDPAGDYVVGGTHYSIVAEPKVEDISTYYELSIDESVQNYVATHVVVDTEGLWLIPDSGGNKVLIATGAGSSYTTAGTYIIGKVSGVDTIFAKFTADKATIGSPSKSHFDVSTNGIKLTDIWGDAYLNIQDYRVGQYEIDQYFVGDGNRAQFNLIVEAIGTSDMAVYVNGTMVTSGITKNVKYVAFNTAPANGSEIEVTYRSQHGASAKAYTMGTRADGSLEGEQSVAIGKMNVASGVNSIAIGSQAEATAYASKSFGTLTKATNLYSHAEGWSSVAGGQMSHAQNRHTIAQGESQTALGKYNVADGVSAVIIGNGTADNARSNALTVDWSGNVNIASGAKYKINGTNLSASDVGAVALSDKYTRSSTGDLAWTNQTDGDAKVIAKSALAFWNGAYAGSGSNLSKCSTGNIIGSNGGTMTGQLLTSFKNSVAMGSYGASATTVPNLVAELRFSSGCMGSASISTAYTKGSITIPTGWYNFIYSPHRSGGANGSASGDNCNYGNLLLMGMTIGGAYLIRVASADIQEVKILGSDYVKATFTPTSGSSYSSYGGCYYEKYGRVVHVHVGMSGLTAGTATVIYTLPSGYRPSTTVFAHGTGGAWNNIGYVEIYADGRISVRSQGAYCGADITFLV